MQGRILLPADFCYRDQTVVGVLHCIRRLKLFVFMHSTLGFNHLKSDLPHSYCILSFGFKQVKQQYLSVRNIDSNST